MHVKKLLTWIQRLLLILRTKWNYRAQTDWTFTTFIYRQGRVYNNILRNAINSEVSLSGSVFLFQFGSPSGPLSNLQSVQLLTSHSPLSLRAVYHVINSNQLEFNLCIYRNRDKIHTYFIQFKIILSDSNLLKKNAQPILTKKRRERER